MGQGSPVRMLYSCPSLGFVLCLPHQLVTVTQECFAGMEGFDSTVSPNLLYRCSLCWPKGAESTTLNSADLLRVNLTNLKGFKITIETSKLPRVTERVSRRG